MIRTDSVFRKRWPFVAAAAVVLAVAVAAGSMFASNSGEQPVQEVAAAQVQPDLTDPGLYANPAASIAEPEEPQPMVAPEALLPEPPQDGQDPGRQSGGSSGFRRPGRMAGRPSCEHGILQHSGRHHSYRSGHELDALPGRGERHDDAG